MIYHRVCGFSRKIKNWHHLLFFRYLSSGDIFFNFDSDYLYHHNYAQVAVDLLREHPEATMVEFGGQITVKILPTVEYVFCFISKVFDSYNWIPESLDLKIKISMSKIKETYYLKMPRH